MKFGSSVEIDLPREKVVALFLDPNNIKEYQEGFIKKELVSGAVGEAGSISKLYFKNGKHEMELTETIVSNNLPDSLEVLYHHEHMDNTYVTSFIALSANKTKYVTAGEYTRINWIMPKLMSILFPGMYRKPAEKWMQNFKTFVENAK